mmetsp:Transcript_65915/g.183633  ORF Transcript_65915/g.183633 Transcript_65915/m.183633 type:complete len:224 (+) Transcript_65915:1544-2215(+)
MNMFCKPIYAPSSATLRGAISRNSWSSPRPASLATGRRAALLANGSEPVPPASQGAPASRSSTSLARAALCWEAPRFRAVPDPACERPIPPASSPGPPPVLLLASVAEPALAPRRALARRAAARLRSSIMSTESSPEATESPSQASMPSSWLASTAVPSLASMPLPTPALAPSPSPSPSVSPSPPSGASVLPDSDVSPSLSRWASLWPIRPAILGAILSVQGS